MSNIYQLQQFISTYRTYNEVKDKAFQIDQFWRESSFSRALRSSTEIEAVHLENKPYKPIVGYKPKNATVTHFEPNSATLRSMSVEDEYIYSLNARLKEIKVRYKPKFGDDIKRIFSEIDGAINSKYEYVKKGVLDKYK